MHDDKNITSEYIISIRLAGLLLFLFHSSIKIARKLVKRREKEEDWVVFIFLFFFLFFLFKQLYGCFLFLIVDEGNKKSISWDLRSIMEKKNYLYSGNI